MPKGSLTPRDRAVERYDALNKRLDNMPKDYSAFSLLRRKVKSFLGTDDGQFVTSSKRDTLLKKLEGMERRMRTAGNQRSLKNIEEEQSR